ncbi:hypothetical protein GCM10009535_09500 [Streptomyces thermocarboxydovorans]|uniref:Uncharacterized protein n=1 Tax=Streptomyces thermocarboxydovorans TaxID=59298 RepID=A0ABP3SIT3_9ACTN
MRGLPEQQIDRPGEPERPGTPARTDDQARRVGWLRPQLEAPDSRSPRRRQGLGVRIVIAAGWNKTDIGQDGSVTSPHAPRQGDRTLLAMVTGGGPFMITGPGSGSPGGTGTGVREQPGAALRPPPGPAHDPQ